MNEIQSVQNPTIRRLKVLKDKKAREEAHEMLVEGEKLMREAAQLKLPVSDALFDADMADRFADLARDMERAGARVYAVPRRLLEVVCDTKTPQGACAAFGLPDFFDAEHAPERLVVLDGVQDPGNVGTIWRTADAAGFQGLLLGEGSADPLSPKVLRAAMGSGFRIPFSQAAPLTDALRTLSDRGYTIIASDLSGEDFYSRSDPGSKMVLVIGNEARGISDAVRQCADMRVKLPMRGGAESLNAAIAAAIMMYDLMNAKR